MKGCFVTLCEKVNFKYYDATNSAFHFADNARNDGFYKDEGEQ